MSNAASCLTNSELLSYYGGKKVFYYKFWLFSRYWNSLDRMIKSYR